MEKMQKETAPFQAVEVHSSFKKFIVSEKGSCVEMKKEATVFKELALQRFSEESPFLEAKEEEVPFQVQFGFQKSVAAERMPRLEEKEEEALFKEMALLRF